MHLPEGYDREDPGEISTYVLRLKKVLYGLKQAPREWNREINQYLREILELYRCEADRCLYVYPKHDLILLLYVDGMLIIGRDENMLIVLKGNCLENDHD
jgi:hypothetical protein